MEGQDSILLKELAKDRLYFAFKEIGSMLIEMNSLAPTKIHLSLDKKAPFTWESSSFSWYRSAKARSQSCQAGSL